MRIVGKSVIIFTDISLNKLIQFYLNNTINLGRLTHGMPIDTNGKIEG